MSDDHWTGLFVWIGIIGFIAWSYMWWKIGSEAYRWDAYAQGKQEARRELQDEAYTEGFEHGVRQACEDKVLPQQLTRPSTGRAKARVKRARG